MKGESDGQIRCMACLRFSAAVFWTLDRCPVCGAPAGPVNARMLGIIREEIRAAAPLAPMSDAERAAGLVAQIKNLGGSIMTALEAIEPKDADTLRQAVRVFTDAAACANRRLESFRPASAPPEEEL
jgi:hypothetical protein